jgi:sugar O-acyltransferase (sialic acid O-acetyltransferase NeuD family)
MAKIVIFGAGRGADIAHRYISKDTDHSVSGFTVDDHCFDANEFKGLPVVKFSDAEKMFPSCEFKMFAPLGSQNMNKLRYEKFKACKEKGYELISYVSSTIPFASDLDIGENCFILENNSINFDVKIGDNVTIWSGNQIGDNSIVFEHCWISSHVCIAGSVIIKPFTFVGINASISNNVIVEEENFIGANALITKNTAVKDVYIVAQTPKAAFPSDKFSSMLSKLV